MPFASWNQLIVEWYLCLGKVINRFVNHFGHYIFDSSYFCQPLLILTSHDSKKFWVFEHGFFLLISYYSLTIFFTPSLFYTINIAKTNLWASVKDINAHFCNMDPSHKSFIIDHVQESSKLLKKLLIFSKMACISNHNCTPPKGLLSSLLLNLGIQPLSVRSQMFPLC